MIRKKIDFTKLQLIDLSNLYLEHCKKQLKKQKRKLIIKASIKILLYIFIIIALDLLRSNNFLSFTSQSNVLAFITCFIYFLSIASCLILASVNCTKILEYLK